MKKLLLVGLAVAGGLLGGGASAATTSTTWLVPAGMVCPSRCVAAAMVGPAVGDGGSVVPPGADRSMGYDPGTSWPTLAFGCPGQLWQGKPMVWLGQDDDHTYSDVKFPQPIAISGVSYLTLGSAHSRTSYAHHGSFWVSSDGVSYRQMGSLDAVLQEGLWTPVSATWSAVEARYFRWIMDDSGSFTNALQMRLLMPAATPRNC